MKMVVYLVANNTVCNGASIHLKLDQGKTFHIQDSVQE